MLSKQRWWNPGTLSLTYESTCLKHISLQPWCWKGRIAAFSLLALLHQKTLVLRYFVNNPMLSKQRWWNPATLTLPYESTCLKHISPQPRFWKESTCLKHISLQPWFWKGRIAAIQFFALLQQQTPVVRYFVKHTMLSKQQWWNADSQTLLIQSTSLRRISLPPRFWKCRIAAIQFLALLQQETTDVRYFVNYTILSKQRWWNAGSRTLLYESTCQKNTSLPPRFLKRIIAAIQFSALLQQKTLVLRHFVYNPMLSKQRWWNPSSRTLTYESTCLKHISLQPWCWKGRIKATSSLALSQ
ncbi:hypothetical protein ANTQUA_LOCUS6934 [Anthophora quadrimaculata]